jgi:leader peptidase (prepilin peptidase)/N-methyltransferase
MDNLSYISPAERFLVYFLFYSPAIFAFIFGTVIGSLSNVIIHRIVYYRSIWSPPSHCGSCGTEIHGKRNIPLVSYLSLRGKCPDCGTKFSSRYFWIELMSGMLYAMIVLYVYTLPQPQGLGLSIGEMLTMKFEDGFPPTFMVDFFGLMMIFKGFVFCTLLLILTAIDLDHKLLPDRLTVAGIILGIVLFWVVPSGPERLGWFSGMDGWWVGILDTLVKMALGLLVGGGILYLIAMAVPGGMGGGDILLLAMIGAFIGIRALGPAMFIGFVLGGLIGAVLMIFGIVKRRSFIPFGPFLAAGGLVGFLYGEQLWSLYSRNFNS